MSTPKPYHYDKEAEYQAEVEPLMHQLYDTCRRIGIPVVAVVQFRAREEGDSIHALGAMATDDGEFINCSPRVMAAHALLHQENQEGASFGQQLCLAECEKARTELLQERYGEAVVGSDADDPDEAE